jgi:hypothetical protein
MNNSILSLHKHQNFEFKQPLSLAHSFVGTPALQSDYLTINYSPYAKLLCAQWSKNTTSSEFRQSVRLLARIAALLRVERILIDMPTCFIVTNEDQQWISNFLVEVMNRAPIRRVARVLPPDETVSEVIQQVLAATGVLPYELHLFEESEPALKWLLEGLDEKITEKGRIRIPLHFNMKLMRSEIFQRGIANIQVAAPQGGQHISMPEPLPDQLEVRTDFVSLSIDTSKSLMSIRWKKAPKSRQYRYGMLKAVRAITEHRLEHLLLNNQRLGVLTLEDQAWLVSTAGRLLPKTKLQKLAVVTSADALQQMSSETIGRKLKEANLKHSTKYFLSEEDAREWLLSDTNLFS